MIAPLRSLLFTAIGHMSPSFFLSYKNAKKKAPRCFLERVGDIDPIGVVYLSFGGGELWQDRSTWLFAVRAALSSTGINNLLNS